VKFKINRPTTHRPYTQHLSLMEQTLTANTGRISLSSLWYCCTAQSAHLLHCWDLHSQQYLLYRRNSTH